MGTPSTGEPGTAAGSPTTPTTTPGRALLEWHWSDAPPLDEFLPRKAYPTWAHVIAAIEQEARADAEAEVARLRDERDAWRRLARRHCGYGCTDEEHGRLLVQYQSAPAATPAPPAPVERGRWYPEMPPALPGETDAQYTDRLTGADRTGRVPYDHRRYRQCSIGYHEECSQNRRPGDCECPCHEPEPAP